jgi:hypothetical protein
MGRVVFQRRLYVAAGSTTLPLSEVSAGLRPGIYLVHLQQGPQRSTVKIVRE